MGKKDVDTYLGKDLVNRALYCERKHLMKALDRFTRAMKARLLERMLQGYRGWDRQERQEVFINMLHQLENKVFMYYGKNYTDDCEVDIANLAMILWNLTEKRKNPGKKEK
jgi:hypothetical protein